ncbi:hypothetical protein GCM10022248_83030 [Nonomuraea soli]
MWHRGLNWAAIVLVGGFALTWLGVVVFAADASALWVRLAQAAFGVFLVGWAIQKTVVMIHD